MIEAGIWLAISRAALLILAFRWTVRLFSLKQGSEQAEVTPAMRDAARRIGQAVRCVSRRTPWQSACLAQSLAGVAMLRRRQIPAVMTMGVARSGGAEPLTAHAWLACDGVILTGASGYDRYQVIMTFIFL